LLVTRYAWAAKAATAIGLLPLLQTLEKVMNDIFNLPPQAKVEDEVKAKCDCGKEAQKIKRAILKL
jgi:hypothetical protein